MIHIFQIPTRLPSKICHRPDAQLTRRSGPQCRSICGGVRLDPSRPRHALFLDTHNRRALLIQNPPRQLHLIPQRSRLHQAFRPPVLRPPLQPRARLPPRSGPRPVPPRPLARRLRLSKRLRLQPLREFRLSTHVPGSARAFGAWRWRARSSTSSSISACSRSPSRSSAR